MIEKVKLHLDKVGYSSKKDIKDKEKGIDKANEIKYRVQHSKPIEINVDEFIRAIEAGKTFSPAIMKGTKRNDFIEQQVFPVDIDNNYGDIPTLSIQDAINICNENSVPLAFYYPSFSHTEEKPKYRLVFILDRVIKNRDERNLIINSLYSLFPQADKSCVNEDRLFYGTNKKVTKCNMTNPLKAEIILKLLPPKKETIKLNEDTTQYYETELDKLKQEFDFCSYLAERNGGIKSNSGNYVMFNKCEICGHNDDLVYYPDNNVFKCFGANGGQARFNY